MNKVEVGKLLTIASGFDRFVTVDRVTTEAWAIALADVSYEDGQKAVVEHYTGPLGDKGMTVKHLLDATAQMSRTTKALIATDVRAARARGIVSRTWPENQALPADLMDRLRGARETDRRDAMVLGLTA